MTWNIQFQFCALVLVLIVAGMCLGQKRLHFSAERTYIRLLFLVIVCVLCDILSVFAIGYREVIGDFLCKLSCKAYLLSLTVVGWQASIFAVDEVRYTFKKTWRNMSITPVIVEIVSLSIFEIQIVNNGSVTYSSGIPVYVTYGLCGVYVISTFTMLIVLKKYVNAKRRVTIMFGLFCWAAVATVQFINNELLMVSYALALACMYIYCKLENPEYHLDFATNSFNRSGFLLIVGEYLKANSDRALISISLGEMNMVKEVFGTHVAEKLILNISEFADGIPESMLFRLEDDLFCMLVDDKDEAEKALEHLARRFEMPWTIGEIEIEASASIAYIESILTFKDSDSLEELVHYFAGESKKLPEGQVLIINDKELENRQRFMEIQHSLEWALKNDGVEVYYQPIYNIKAGKFSAMEALVRLRDENDNLIMPGEFVEAAERNGMILSLGEIVFRKTCEFMQRMHIEDYGIEYIEVNLSVVQCMQENLSRLLMNIMGEYQIHPHRINFEITETSAANFKRVMDKNMRELLKYGCGFSLDDYGSGYSNLSYVVNLPLKIVKIDKLMADEYFTSEKVKIATDYTIEMLHKLGMEIVVEGIETEKQYLAFKELGVEYIQGYYFSKPLHKDRVLQFIQEWL